jgi:type I restriction enzyme R subunit
MPQDQLDNKDSAQRTVRTTSALPMPQDPLDNKDSAQGTVRATSALPMPQDPLDNKESAQGTVRTTFSFYDPEQPVSRTRGHLPHWEQDRATYFITWRLADSIPKRVWESWRERRSAWLRSHRIDPDGADWRRLLENLPDEVRRDFRRFATQLEDELDAGHGACSLRKMDLALIVADALRHWDGEKYLLGDFVIMPNHVHLLVGGLSHGKMLAQVTSWKKWSALQINKATGERGRLWQDESFDHLVRSVGAFQKFRKYIAGNPEKGHLREGEFLLWQRPE